MKPAVITECTNSEQNGMTVSQLSAKKSVGLSQDKIRQVCLQAQQDEDYPGLERVTTARSQLAAHNITSKHVNNPLSNELYERISNYIAKKCDFDQTNALWNTAIQKMIVQNNYYPSKLLRLYCACGKLKKTSGECCRQVKSYTDDPEVVREMQAILEQRQVSLAQEPACESAPVQTVGFSLLSLLVAAAPR